MRVAVMTAGSRGDVAPYTGLAHGLARAGHEVTLATHGSFRPLVAATGVGFRPLPVDPRAVLESEQGRGLHDSTTGAGKILRLMSIARTVVGELAAELVHVARDSDVLLLSSSLAPLGYAIGQGLGIPSMGAYLQPLHPTGAFGPSVIGTRSFGPAGNRLAARAVNAGVDGIFTSTLRTTVRQLLDLPHGSARATRHAARERRLWPVHHGFSPLIVPRPRDWRPGLTVSGYWWPYDPPDAELPARVRAFLDAGPPPVFVGLGSATVPHPARTSALVVRALRAAGLRGVIQRGWAGLRADEGVDAGAEDMLTVDDVPHALLFPRMAAVVHHCGAGTTGAGLRAGVPAVPVPVQFDAGFWAARLVALGVAPTAVPLRQLTADRLAAALAAAVRNPVYGRRAERVATRLRAEDGVGAVVTALNNLAAAPPPGARAADGARPAPRGQGGER
ncbi:MULTISPECIES: glycosyltransferase [unclassified Streptomyces]|uniref:glycosyltransferase n=1 Tax=unclassified Streptomyces TaxID=2593676 RepID=UPI002DD8DA17|nr:MULTISPECIES: glycosyltransferase [unclassified Streptomyces]WSA95865.1 glycosyltransferase [Streptomyces sp. NBC_01795]WSS11509.1 glycosyltransferase [Streptomyces sp. NBC_01186]WSS40223.1 glycosyltransferase [Streptomyces sp. NBC_01187]